MAFVHLHNHTVYSMLDGATRIKDMVQRAVDLGQPAVAITDHGYMYGVPELGLACDAVNHGTPEYKVWSHDKSFLEKGRRDELECPDKDADPRGYEQHMKDLAMWDAQGNIDELKPPLVIKPIFGCEVYFTPDDTLARDRKPELYHMVLFAQNEKGYVNLMQTVSEAAVQGFYYKPRVTLDNLRRHREGLIASSACIAGIIPKCIDRGEMDKAIEWAETFRDTFEPGNFYIEIQEHGITTDSGITDEELSKTLIEIARQVGVKVIATNDFHYLTRDDAPVQDVIMCIGTGSKIDDPNRIRMEGSEFYMKTEDEMRALFPYCPEACDNTLEIAEKCNVELDWDSIILPNYPLLDPGETHESQFRRECEEGLAKRYGADWDGKEIGGVDIRERFEFEYKVICDKGFAAYFLIVAEYVRWAKQNGIGVGPGRGSAAGALVAYAMDITTFDPLSNGLMFERFLSPERTEMPDIDMDFDDERRLEVVEHVRQLYGPEKVTHVITYSTIKAKQAINDAARVLDYPVYMGQRLSKMVPGDPGVKLKQVLEKIPGKEDMYNPDLVEAYQKDEDARRIIDTALSIEGLTRGEGVHACAVLICRDAVNEHVPTKLDTKGGVEITQYEGHTVADMGLLKMDFLGLRTLTVISKAKANIKKNFGIDIDVDAIPFDDPKIFELMSSGRTAGVFQVESAGMTATIKNMKPTEYKHVVALIALYRPGPLGAGMVTSYINRMNGKEPAVSYDPRLDGILGETYGTMVYQEQVMLISVEMCGFSKGESDSRIRKPVAKKKIKMLTDQVFKWSDGEDETIYDHWMNGAEKNGYKREVAQKIWDDVLEFASYAFNKSHSAGYAILVMQTAWLKAHYPNEYMAAVLTSYTGKTDKIVHYVSACRHDGIAVLPPDINESGTEFTATAEGVRFGLAGIRGVGEGVTEAIIAEREKGGPFKNLHDFVERVDASQANRRVIEALIKGGAFDSTGYPRRQLMHFVDRDNPENIIDAAVKRQKDRAAGQTSLFDVFGDVEGSGFEVIVPEPDGQEWDRHMKLSFEKEVLGIYVSDHPLRPYEYALAKAREFTLSQIDTGFETMGPAGNAVNQEIPEGKPYWWAGMVSSVSKRVTKNGDPMAIVTLEDMEGEATVVIFPKTYKQCEGYLYGEVDPETGAQLSDAFIRVKGKLERSDRGDQIIAQEIEPLVLNEESNRPKVFEVMIPSSRFSQSNMARLATVLNTNPGGDRVELFIEQADGQTMRAEIPTRVNARSIPLIAEVKGIVGNKGRVTVI
ncbi:DNA polymerase III subunit alpha [Collinsella stercoris]|uniref:DNA polymerase III subunit alpha n=1 Tax=Collinsella stercoris DSM 13279 TaxID=445975 RepID=B6GE79_9ACTN|nr:DNA polymerase III subunit alpha [Collinsella stercoris]EEA89421.1 DNA polymerase III, alpha subunit [Collinsella stercoris DSM 13279]UEA45765.1 DNA polymerase III subunit alpha [Collinsella stercoris DSM 13279]UWP11712.1 DNA polymerase III subunit alpha [Collinsella stercoris]